MKIDCRDLACPEPVINTKKSLELLPEDGILDVLLNTNSSIENVTRFAQKSGYEVKSEPEGNATKLTIVKGFTCNVDEEDNKFLNKTIFLKDDKVGEGELGSMLMVGFLKSVLEQTKLPKTITCVNKGVLLTTAAKDSDIIAVLKELESKGVEIFSCGICLDFYKVKDELKVGKVGNAFAIVEDLLNSDGTITL